MAGSSLEALRKLALENADLDEADLVIPEAQVAKPVEVVAPIRTVFEEEIVADPSADLQARKRKNEVPLDKVRETKVARQSEKKKSSRAGEGSGKHKSTSSKKPEPVAVDPNFLAGNMEEYQVDPVRAAAKLFVHLADVQQIEKDRMQRKLEELVGAEQERLRKAQNDVLAKDRRILQLNEKLTAQKARIEELEKSSEQYRNSLAEYENGAKFYENRIIELEAEKKSAEENVDKLQGRIKQLEADLKKHMHSEVAAGSSSVKDTGKLEAELAKTKADLAKSKRAALAATELAFKVAGEGFDLALQQVSLLHPSINLDRSILSLDHQVEEGRLVKVDLKTKERSVLFPKSA